MFQWSAIRNHLRDMLPYIRFGFILFFAGIIIGGTNTAFESFIQGQMNSLKQMGDSIEDSSNPTLMFMIIIFLNNAVKAIFVMYLGALFGIIPLLFLLVNGMVVGYLIHHTLMAEGAGYTLDLIVRGLLPHGWIEIPAIVLACAYGMKFGTLVLSGLGQVLRRKQGAFASVESFVVRTIPIMVILVVAMLVASIIESTLTVWLISL
ncbi:stage II sporulation protein M [Paenibacillus sp. GCM10023252]|uniref:stage II sporulation protein M n=1 Tax=Paenibacillus sp. GCM10023252 TaxID=3252649 RepID=UPI00360DABCA